MWLGDPLFRYRVFGRKATFRRNKIDLQLFAQEKTEQATPHRRQEARRKGQVFKSQEISSALLFLAGFFTLYLVISYMGAELERLFRWVFSLDPTITSLSGYFPKLLLPLLRSFLKIIFPLWGTVLLVGIMANFSQVGFVFTGEPLRLKPERLHPMEGWKRIFSRSAFIQLVKSVIKLLVVSLLMYRMLGNNLESLALLSLMDLTAGIRFIGKTALHLGIYSGLALLLLGILDLFYQRWEFNKNLMMSKQEIKDELKQQEGDPQVRSRIRERQRQIGMRRMMAEIPNADVIITNPVHYAVALKYDAKSMKAPKVLAKGKEYLAQRIKEIAKKNDIPQVENPSLARGLYWAVEPGEEIPGEFYQAVAEVLAFIYKLRKQS
ncbi:MAG: flagellar biosynthesis protein FlhB [bacterium]|jgi:flagellar biosynthetic protein FlhB